MKNMNEVQIYLFSKKEVERSYARENFLNVLQQIKAELHEI